MNGAGISVEELLAEARSGLNRMTPEEAWEALESGAMLVDTRPVEQRRQLGEVPGSLVVDRNVLEWRLDPRSPHRLPQATGESRVIVLCQQGYSSSLAAASLQRLGVAGATDVVGGMESWVAAGLPTAPFRE
ncbi:MAG TPA: rhodanese-like domain-containing protein [Mycobacteriales bacterium]|nr:rhodanese-like domain-containing protein [Mycobacteriales bacterium]